MADINGVNYALEHVNEPAEQAEVATRNAIVKYMVDDYSGAAAADKILIHKLYHRAVLKELTALVGTLGAGGLFSRDKDGNEVAISIGDEVDGQVEEGLDILLLADGATSAAGKIAVGWLAG